MLVYGLATLSCAGLGYLVGPVVGAQCWRLTHRRSLALIEARDREFHRHVVRHRVDPSAQSATNPVPDFYGEKIGSLRDYRQVSRLCCARSAAVSSSCSTSLRFVQWLRDQAKYRRKAFLPEDEA